MICEIETWKKRRGFFCTCTCCRADKSNDPVNGKWIGCIYCVPSWDNAEKRHPALITRDPILTPYVQTKRSQNIPISPNIVYTRYCSAIPVIVTVKSDMERRIVAFVVSRSELEDSKTDCGRRCTASRKRDDRKANWQ
jgi:hypothetical protein